MAYSSITKPTDYFNTKLYSGDGSSSQPQTGVGFQPDWVWLKSRNTTDTHALIDSVRGATKAIRSNGSNAEVTDTAGLISFDTDGFTVGNSGPYGANGQNYVAWNWLASGSTSSNGDGATTSTVSVNSTAGFSIVKWTGTGSGTTIGHGLGAKPKIIFVKNVSSARNWVVNVGEMVGADERSLYLNATDAIKNDAAADHGYTYNNTTTTFQTAGGSGGTQDDVNKNGDTIIAYCFAEKTGYSKFGQYTGNGNADGRFVYTGFKPAWIMQKRYDSSNGWHIFDNKRDPFNACDTYLTANQTSAEASGVDYVDFLSNGLKMRRNGNDINGTNATYIYMAFAEEPLVANTGGGIPATAR